MLLRILIVDDEDHIRNLLALALKAHYRVDRAENGMEAFERLITESFDLVITDFNMPIMDGLELTKKIKAQFPNLPVIIMSGNTESFPDLLKTGADACLKKPLDFTRLKTMIKNLLKPSVVA